MTPAISTRSHGAIDYGVAALFGALAGSRWFSPRVRGVLGTAGAYHTGYSVLTDYEAGIVPLVNMRQHLALDALGGLGLCAAGLLMRREPLPARALMLVAGLSELAVVAASQRNPVSGPGQGGSLVGRMVRTSAPVAVAYAPIDTPKAVADGVWVVDAEPIHILGMPLPIRMAVLLLANGDLILHSPTRFSLDLRSRLERLGRIRYLVAPNIVHWTFLKEWQRRCPDTITYAAPGLRERSQVREAGVVVDHDLSETVPDAWRDQITLVVIPGGAGFREIAFFHDASRTAVLTDLVLNLEAHKLPAPVRGFSRLVGALAPNGRAPIYLRAVISLRRTSARRAARRLLALRPERVIFAHGKWFEHDGAARLRRSLAWLGV